LTSSKVDRNEGTVRLEAGETKNDEGRTIYLDEELKKPFKIQWLRRHPGSELVSHVNGKSIKDFRKSWQAACEGAHIKGKLFHDLRRTAARNMIRSGVPERVAMMISGHKTRAVFDRYNVVSGDDLKQAAAKQEAYLQGMEI
jgi:integrase